MRQLHYNDVIMSAIASRLFTQAFIQTHIKENIKAPRHWPLCGEFTGDRWIPRTNGQQRGKYFKLMTSSCTRMALPLQRLNSLGPTKITLIPKHMIWKYKYFWTENKTVRIANVYVFENTDRSMLDQLMVWFRQFKRSLLMVQWTIFCHPMMSLGRIALN